MSSVVVLVVDGDPIVGFSIFEVLSSEGFEPIVVHDAEHALAVLDSRTDVAVLFTDIKLRGSLNGRELAIAARGLQPTIRIVVLSAFARSEVGDLPEGTIYLGKPCGDQQIVTAVIQALRDEACPRPSLIKNTR